LPAPQIPGIGAGEKIRRFKEIVSGSAANCRYYQCTRAGVGALAVVWKRCHSLILDGELHHDRGRGPGDYFQLVRQF
jgi:hypothetical protein